MLVLLYLLNARTPNALYWKTMQDLQCGISEVSHEVVQVGSWSY